MPTTISSETTPKRTWDDLIKLVAFMAVAGPLYLMFAGWVLSWYWQWFAVPFGLPPISVPWAIGLFLGCRFVIWQQDNETQPRRRPMAEVVKRFLISVQFVAFVFAIGWLVHAFM